MVFNILNLLNIFGGQERLIETKNNDKIKNNYCKENNILLIRIKFNENIKDRLEKFFS
jgi:hypothetical protein